MRLAKISWVKVEEYFKDHDIVMIPFGSTECHGKHMPLGTDFMIPDKIAENIEEKTEILVAPVIQYGMCDYLTDFPGTISIGDELLYRLADKIAENLWRAGARRFVFLNGHGGNRNALECVSRNIHKKGGAAVILNWWSMAGELDPKWAGGHGGGEETSAIMAIDPNLVDRSQISDSAAAQFSDTILVNGLNTVQFKGINVSMPRSVRSVTGNGWFGPDHPADASAEWGREMLSAFSEWAVEFIDEFKKIPLQ